MKALKYGLTLVLGLTMLGFSARVQAQSSGQTAEVVPAHATPLPDVPAVQAQDDQMLEEIPQRGIRTPREIERLLDQKEFEAAIKEFTAFMKTAKGNACDLIYLPLSFYERLADEDVANKEQHSVQVKSYLNKYMQTCGQTADVYLLQERFDKQTLEVTVERMTQAIKLDPEYAMLYTMRGEALWTLKRAEEACADYRKAKELGDPVVEGFLMQNCPEQQEQ